MLSVSRLFIYPVKSLGEITVSKVSLSDRGFRWDRRWMLTDEGGHFLSQRQYPEMALLAPSLGKEGITIHHKNNHQSLQVPYEPETKTLIPVQVWNDTCLAQKVSKEADLWLSRQLGFPCQLVYMPDQTYRRVDPDYAAHEEITSFSDAFPMMMIGQASLDDLNHRLSQPVPMNRFRPNIVFEGGHPYEEDEMEHFTINGIDFYGVKPCARCHITTIDQDTAQKGAEPLKTLSEYRRIGHKILFGQNLLFKGQGEIGIGDVIEVRRKKSSPFEISSIK